MATQDHPEIDLAQVIDSARAVENAVHEQCSATMASPGLAAEEADVVLAHLTAAAGALPQAARQLSGILDQARHNHCLAMDDLTITTDPDIAINTAPVHLNATAEPAQLLYRHLDAAHQQTAHIATIGDELGSEPDAPREASIGRRAEDHEPTPMRSTDRGWDISR